MFFSVNILDPCLCQRPQADQPPTCIQTALMDPQRDGPLRTPRTATPSAPRLALPLPSSTQRTSTQRSSASRASSHEKEEMAATDGWSAPVKARAGRVVMRSPSPKALPASVNLMVGATPRGGNARASNESARGVVVSVARGGGGTGGPVSPPSPSKARRRQNWSTAPYTRPETSTPAGNAHAASSSSSSSSSALVARHDLSLTEPARVRIPRVASSSTTSPRAAPAAAAAQAAAAARLDTDEPPARSALLARNELLARPPPLAPPLAPPGLTAAPPTVTLPPSRKATAPVAVRPVAAKPAENSAKVCGSCGSKQATTRLRLATAAAHARCSTLLPIATSPW